MFFAFLAETPNFTDETPMFWPSSRPMRHMRIVSSSESSDSRNAEGFFGAWRPSEPDGLAERSEIEGFGAVVRTTRCTETLKLPTGRVMPSSSRLRYQRLPSNRMPEELPASTSDHCSVPRAMTA